MKTGLVVCVIFLTHKQIYEVIPRLYRQPCKISSAEGTSHLHVAFNEACSLDSSLYVKADVHLDISPLVGQLDDWHLKDEEMDQQTLVVSFCKNMLTVSWNTKRKKGKEKKKGTTVPNESF